MKRIAFFVLPITITTALLLGCSNNTTQSARKGIVFNASSQADFNELASTLNDLENKSIFIAKVSVEEAHSYVYPNSDDIYTQITPNVLEIYKGSYNNEKLELYGGEMLYTDYYNALSDEDKEMNSFDTSKYSQNEIDSARVYWNFCNLYVPQVGDTLLYFGVRSDDGNYYVSYDYQGVFLLQDGNYVNQALIVDQNNWQEPLVTDLLSLTETKIVDSTENLVRTIDNVEYTYHQDSYSTMVAIPENTLIRAIQE